VRRDKFQVVWWWIRVCGGGFVVCGGGDAVERQSIKIVSSGSFLLMFERWQNGWVGGGQHEGYRGYWWLRGVMEIVVLHDGWGFLEVWFLRSGMNGVVMYNLDSDFVTDFVAACDDV